MGAPENLIFLRELAGRCGVPALANCLLRMSCFAEAPNEAEAQVIVCQLDCVADETTCDAATRALASMLARCWLRGAPGQGMTAIR